MSLWSCCVQVLAFKLSTRLESPRVGRPPVARPHASRNSVRYPDSSLSHRRRPVSLLLPLAKVRDSSLARCFCSLAPVDLLTSRRRPVRKSSQQARPNSAARCNLALVSVASSLSCWRLDSFVHPPRATPDSRRQNGRPEMSLGQAGRRQDKHEQAD